MASAPYRLSLRGISRAFPGVQALADVGFDVARGEVHALVGENGAGKSTLLKILSGVDRADAGEVRLDGQAVILSSPKLARQHGIALIHQELQQVPNLDVAQNMFLGTPLTRLGVLTDRAAMRDRARGVLARLDPGIDVTTPIRELRVAQRQIVEIGRALLAEARVVAMDEPTSSLTPVEFRRLADVIETLSKQGVAVIYVSHKLDEVLRLASRATVLRDGRLVGSIDLAEATEAQLIGMMVGRALDVRLQKGHARPEKVLEVEGLGRGQAVQEVSFDLRAGEVLGIAGLMGAGRTELVRLIAGVDRPSAGTIRIDGRAVSFSSPRDAVGNGVALLPEDRKRDGIVPLRSILSNAALPILRTMSRFGLIRARHLRRRVTELTRRVNLRPPAIDRPIRLFSGGNQQKAILCRWLMADARILIFDEPTRGIDVGAKSEIYQLIEELAEQGRAVIVVSSELSEILRLADRVLVMWRSRSAGVLEGAMLSEETIMQRAVSGLQAA